jgi:heme oxygenase
MNGLAEIMPRMAGLVSVNHHESGKDECRMSDTRGIMQRLKEDTRQSHDAAEAQGFMTDLMAGRLPRGVYGAALPQLRRVRAAIEQALAEARATSPVIQATFQPYHEIAGAFDADIAFFGADPNAEPNSGTAGLLDLIQRLRQEDPVLLLGVFYVLEGSNLGAQVIKKRLKEVYNLTDGQGTASMDVHGPLLMPRWREFSQAMDAQPLTEAQKARLVEVATETFRLVGQLYAEVYTSGAAPVGPA